MPDPMGPIEYTWPFYAGFVLAYLLGSIPFGLVLTRMAGLGDIRAIGSHNIGATNVLRTGRKGLAPPPCCWTAARASSRSPSDGNSAPTWRSWPRSAPCSATASPSG